MLNNKFTLLLNIFTILLLGCSSYSETAFVSTPNTQSPQNKLKFCQEPKEPTIGGEEILLPGTPIVNLGKNIVALGNNLSDDEIVILSREENEWFIGLSPSGNWLAYGSGSPLLGETFTLHLQSDRGEVVETSISSNFPAHLESGSAWYSSQWISDEVMLVVFNNGTPPSKQLSIALLNPFTGIWNQSILNNFPNRYQSGGIAISPDLTRALYVAEVADGFRLVLWDMLLGEEIWQLENFSNYAMIDETVPAIWSKNSRWVAFVDWGNSTNGATIFELDRSGENLHIIRSSVPSNSAYGLNWSPNGQYLAMVSNFVSDPSKNGLIIFNKATNEIIDFCPVVDGVNPVNNIQDGRLLWSPDSRYLAYGLGADPIGDDNAIAIVDIYSGTNTIIKKGSRAILSGWSESKEWLP